MLPVRGSVADVDGTHGLQLHGVAGVEGAAVGCRVVVQVAGG